MHLWGGLLISRRPPHIAMKLKLGLILALFTITVCRADTAPPPAKADVPALLAKLAEQNPRTTKATLEALGQSGEPRLVPFLKEDYMKSSAYVYQDKVVLNGAGKGGILQLLDPLNPAPLEDRNGAP